MLFFFFSFTICVPHVTILTQCFQHCFLWIISISCRHLFPLIIYGCSQHQALNAPGAMDLGANVSETPLLLDLPFALQIKALLLWQTGVFMLVGSGRWAAGEQCHPHLGSSGPLQGPLLCQSSQTQPRLTLSLPGNKVRWHPITGGFPGHRGRCGLAPSGQQQVYMT